MRTLICTAMLSAALFPAVFHAYAAKPVRIVGAAVEPAKGEAIDIDKLPKAVVEAVQKEMPGARLGKALKQADGNYFLSDVKLGKREYNLTVSADGKILKKTEDSD